MPSLFSSPAFHIYCDEYGDQSLKKTASELFIYSAVVVAASREQAIPKWVERINLRRRHWAGEPLHWTDLDERKKLWATRFLGKLPIRCFVIISHKHNVLNYRNVRAERASDWRSYGDDGTSFTALPRRKLWYSHMVLKILLERATAWCRDRSLREYREARPASITIAQRGGFYIDRFKEYLEKDKRNAVRRSGILPGYLAWDVADTNLVSSAPANNVAGLQLADIVTGAFSRAIDERQFGSCDLRYALNLTSRIPSKGYPKRMAGWGITVLPWKLWEAPFSDAQKAALITLGFTREELVRPGPILPVE